VVSSVAEMAPYHTMASSPHAVESPAAAVARSPAEGIPIAGMASVGRRRHEAASSANGINTDRAHHPPAIRRRHVTPVKTARSATPTRCRRHVTPTRVTAESAVQPPWAVKR
jgi:hypothetical protein